MLKKIIAVMLAAVFLAAAFAGCSAAEISCNDGFRPVSFYIETIE